MNITINHEIEKNSQGKIRFRKFKKGGYDHYKIRLFLDGDDLANVLSVEYELHPTFANRYRAVDDPSENFSLSIWTWGEFDIAATAVFTDGKTETFMHSLTYSNQLPSSDDAYVDESPEKFREH